MGGRENLAGRQMTEAMKGLTPEQRRLVKLLIPNVVHRSKGGRTEGWSIYREPTTVNPPTTLRLLKRDGQGKLIQVINITERGITK